MSIEKTKTIAAVIAMATDVGRLKAEGKDDEARELQLKLDAVALKASRTKKGYDVWEHYLVKIERFGTRRARWQQARRSVHADRGGTSSSKALTKEYERIWDEGQAEGRTAKDLLRELAIHAVVSAAEHDWSTSITFTHQRQLDLPIDLLG